MPEEYREEFQRKLGELRDAAPKVRFEDMRKVIEADLDEPLEETFAAFDEEPIAAASIGQVYRARLHDGRDVAVKVQYPGVAQAVRADMQNLGLILRLMKRVAPGLDVKALAEEIRERIGDELDYELEAQNQRPLARIYRGHPFIVVPDVVTRALARARARHRVRRRARASTRSRRWTRPTRDRVGEIVFRFFFGCMYRHHQFSGDPHPGNFLLLADGRVAFLDFGLFKIMPPELIELELACQRAGHEGDGEQLKRILDRRPASSSSPSASGPTSCSPSSSTRPGGTCSTRRSQLEPEVATQVMIDMSDPRSEHFGADAPRDAAGRPSLRPPRRDAHARRPLRSCARATTSTGSRASGCTATPPVTELGRQEAAFYAGSA